MAFGVVGSGQQPGRMPAAGFFRDVATAAEATGFDSLWTTDHIAFVNPILEGLVALSFFAGVTRRIRVGTGIYLLALRHPSAVAKQVASLDHLANGRLIFGIGVGGESHEDFAAVGIPRRERGPRTDEALEVLRALLAKRDVSHRDRFYTLEQVTISPPPVQSPAPPIWVGGRSDAALARAARHGDGWLAYLTSPARLRAGLEVIARHARATGRDGDEITPAIMLPVHVDRDPALARRIASQHLSARYARPFPAELLDRCCAVGTPEDVIASVSRYLDAGARHIVFSPAGAAEDVVGTIETLADEVLPALRRRVQEGAA